MSCARLGLFDFSMCCMYNFITGHEVRIGPYRVDGYETNDATGEVTVYEFQGCYYHGHECFLNSPGRSDIAKQPQPSHPSLASDSHNTAAAAATTVRATPIAAVDTTTAAEESTSTTTAAAAEIVLAAGSKDECHTVMETDEEEEEDDGENATVLTNRQKLSQQRAAHTREKMRFLRNCGVKVVELKECDYVLLKRRDRSLQEFIKLQRPAFYQQHPTPVTSECILKAVTNGQLFGALEVDIHVDPNDYERWEEFSPLFTSTDIPFSAIGKTMQDYWNATNTCPSTGKPTKFPTKRLLVGGMRAVKIMLSSDLLCWYLQHGLVCTKIYQVR